MALEDEQAKPLIPAKDKPKVKTYSAKELRDKRRNDPGFARKAKALQRGMCQ